MARADQLDRADPNIAAIRKSGAVKLKVYVGDDAKEVAIAKTRNRWTKLDEVLGTMPWDRIECLDGRGGILHVIESELEDVDGEVDMFEAETDYRIEQLKLAKVLFAVMKHTMAECRKSFETQTKGMAELVGALVEGLHEQRELHRLALAAQVSGGQSEEMEVIKMALMAGLSQKPRIMPPRPNNQGAKP